MTMHSDTALGKSHKKRLFWLFACTTLLVAAAIAFTLSVLSEKRSSILKETADTCREELVLLNARLAEWRSSTQAVISSIAQENLFRVFLSDYASTESGIARFEALKKETDSQESEFYHYLGDVLSDVARMHGIRNAALLLPDGRPLLGEPLDVDKAFLKGSGSFRIISCSEENGSAYARTVTAVFPVDDDERAGAYLLLDIPLDNGFAKVLSSETHNSMQYALLTSSGRLTLSGGNVRFQPGGSAAFPVDSFIEENGTDLCMYAAVSDPAEGFLRASIAKDIIEGREAKAKWNVLIYAITAIAALLMLALALYFAEMAANESRLNRRISHHSFLLESINSSVENGIVLVEPGGTVLYKNKQFPGADWERVPLSAIIPGDAATGILDKTREVIADRKPATIETTMQQNDEKRLYRVALFPYVPERKKGADALAVIQFTDITVFRQRAMEQKRRVESLLDVFACAMESVDKGFRGQTQKMLAVIDLLRTPLALSPDEIQTLSIAARLQSISKLFIPRELVTKQGKLTDEEKARIAQANAMASHMIQNFDFRLPVSETLGQSNERMDGTGRPAGLKGDAILKTARVLAVVTSFCAMTSPRSYRAAFSAAEALQKLSSDTGYDRTIVDSLAGCGTEALEQLSSTADD